LKREQKGALLDDLHGKFVKAKLAVITDYRGLTVPAVDQLRRQLRAKGTEYRVAKNTLLKKAVVGTEFEVLKDYFEGTSAIAVSYDDLVGPAKILNNFSKDNPLLTLRVAALNGKVLSAEDIKSLAQLPPREVLLAKLLALMNAVPTRFVQILSGIPRQFLYTLQAIKDKKEQTIN